VSLLQEEAAVEEELQQEREAGVESLREEELHSLLDRRRRSRTDGRTSPDRRKVKFSKD